MTAEIQIALEQAVALTQSALSQGADLLIVNKFGKHEADGRGMRPLIGEALAMGLVNTVVPADELMDTAMQWAQEVADNAPMAVQTTKRMMRMGMEESYDTAVDHLMVHLSGLFP